MILTTINIIIIIIYIIIGRYQYLYRAEDIEVEEGVFKTKHSYTKPPWFMNKNRRDKVDNMLNELKIPLGSNSKLLPIFSRIKHMKYSELLLYIGDIGVYVIKLCNLSE